MLISRFIDIDDPYVVERVLCNCLGTILSWKTEKNLYGEIVRYNDEYVGRNIKVQTLSELLRGQRIVTNITVTSEIFQKGLRIWERTIYKS